MGLLNKLFEKIQADKQSEVQVIKQAKRDIDDILIEQTEDGRNVFEFYDAHRNFRKYSNTIRVIINNKPRIVKNRELYDCMVAWWKQEDPENEEERMQKRQIASYEHVIAGIDQERMISDFEYLKFIMRNLLEENMVKRYIETAMIPEEDFKKTEYCHLKPCGRYVGEIITENNIIAKRFSNDIGRILHHSFEVQCERRAVIRYNEAKMKADIERKKVEFEEKNAEITKYEMQDYEMQNIV